MMWFRFAAAALIVFFAGRRLGELAGETASLTGLGKGFIGALILGLISSLPEFVTTLAAVVFGHNPELGVGGVLGANLFNLAILALLSLIYSRRFCASASTSGMLGGLAITGSGLLLLAFGSSLAGAPPSGLVLDGVIIVSCIWGLSLARTELIESEIRTENTPHSLKSNLGLIALFGVLVVLAGVLLADTCGEITRRAGLSASLVGALFMGTVVALPEIVVVEQLLRQGQCELARANVFGACLFNLVFLALIDLVWSGSVYAGAKVAPVMLLGAGVIMLGLMQAATHPERKARVKLELLLALTAYGWVYCWLSAH